MNIEINNSEEKIRLTSYSHGAGCGCKIAPKVLEQILEGSVAFPDKNLIVGNHSKDDAAVYDLGNGTAVISTTDFFMPIVDDPYEFGRIAAANSISDIYAMGGTPLMAIAILGWPVNTLAPDIAGKVIEGGRSICAEAGIALAGGHSIDNPEPVFGLAVTGIVDRDKIKQNNTAREGDILLLTKPIGVGILTTAGKRNLVKEEDAIKAAKQMMQLNKVGKALGQIKGVHALTDVTGFGLGGHLVEMADGSGVTAYLDFSKVPLITDMEHYLQHKTFPGAIPRNWNSYGDRISIQNAENEFAILNLLPDPQTNGGLLISLDPNSYEEVANVLKEYGLENFLEPIGKMVAKESMAVIVK
ncbi:MAG: selenide, water dikinase SelD [Flavitalea sp.]